MRKYEGVCEECGREHQLDPGLAGGLILEDGSFANLRNRRPELVPKIYGHSRAWFWWRARYVQRKRRLCSNCGGRHESREIGAPREYGCTTSLLTAGLLATLIGIRTESVWVGIEVFLLTALVLLWSVTRIAKGIARLRARQLKTSIDDLPCCTAPAPVPLKRLIKGKYVCRACGKMAVSFREIHFRT